MKIMFIIPRMVGGGAERVISVLANEFVNRQIGVKILMTSGSDMAYKLDDRIKVIQIGGRSGGSLWKRLLRIARMRKVFRSNPEDILVAFEPATAFFTCLAKLGLRRKLVSSERNDPKSFENDRIREYAYRHSDKVVFQTKDAMMYFPKDIQENHYCQSYYGKSSGSLYREEKAYGGCSRTAGRTEESCEPVLRVSGFSTSLSGLCAPFVWAGES